MIKVINIKDGYGDSKAKEAGEAKGGGEAKELSGGEAKELSDGSDGEAEELSDSEAGEADAFFSDTVSDISGGSVVRALSSDPMFLVLTKFLVSKRGNNVADILEEIKDHLAFLRHRLA